MANEGEFSQEALRAEIEQTKADVASEVNKLKAGQEKLAEVEEEMLAEERQELASEIKELEVQISQDSEKLPNFKKYLYAFILAVLLDGADYFGLAVPYLGDVFDIVGSILQVSLIGTAGLGGLIELIPAVDFFPTFIVIVVAGYLVDFTRSKDQRAAVATKIDLANQKVAKAKSSKELSAYLEENKIKIPSFKFGLSTAIPTIKMGMGKTNWLFLIIFLVVAYFASPYLIGAGFGFYQDFDAEHAAETSIFSGLNVLTDGIQNYLDQINKNIQRASGDYEEGDQVEQSFAGIEFTPPILPNPKSAQHGEQVEISTRVHGFSNEHITVENFCYSGISTDFNLGSGFKTLPESKKYLPSPSTLSGTSFIEEVTCFTTPMIDLTDQKKDTWYTYIQSEVQNLQIDANLVNYFIKKDQLEGILEAAGRASSNTLDTEAEIYSAIRNEFPEITKGNIVSLSDPGPISVIISTSKAPAIGIEDDSTIKLGVALENTLDGRITQIHGVRLLIPQGFTKDEERCASWESQEQGSIDLKEDALKSRLGNFDDIKKGIQLQLPSCTLKVSNLDTLLFGGYSVVNPSKFTAIVELNYAIQEVHRTTVEGEYASPVDDTTNLDPSAVLIADYYSLTQTPDSFLTCQAVKPASSFTTDQAKAQVNAIATSLQIPVNVATGLVQSESSWVHTKSDGTITSNPNPGSCDYGYMQINAKAHKACYDITASRSNSICNVPQCSGKTPIEPECNIAAGLNLLRQNYDRFKDGIPSTTLAAGGCPLAHKNHELYASYREWDAALRAYNGLNCQNELFVSYVDKVNSNINQA